MNKRIYVPFDVFGMREEVCVSSLVRDGNLGWTCGQCPLDKHGNVVAPNDLYSQAQFVCEMIDDVVPRGGFDPSMIGKLMVYFNENTPDEAETTIDFIRTHFPRAVVIPMKVPEFYYSGMMLEVDVFLCIGSQPRHQNSEATGLSIVEADDVTWAHVHVRLNTGETLADAMRQIETDLKTENLFAENLLSDQWFASRDLATSGDFSQLMAESPVQSLANSILLVDGTNESFLSAEMTFLKERTLTNYALDHQGALRIITRHDEHHFSISGVYSDPSGDSASQGNKIMSGIAVELSAHGMSFANVVKVTAHYVGDSTASALHKNLAVRHSYYGKPGPASTGLRVASLLNSDCSITISVAAIRE